MTFENSWLNTLFRGQLQQGIYVASSGGKYLGRMNRGWPDPDADGTLAALKQALAEYRQMSPSERRLSRQLDPAKDKLKWEQDRFVKPTGTLDLRISSRGYPFRGMSTFDQRHPSYFHVDRLWFKPSEWRAWIPGDLRVGAETLVKGPARNRIVLLSHSQAGGSAWWEEHIVGGQMKSKVVSLHGDTVELKITADYRMKANSEWCKDTYDGNLIAFATYNRKLDRFTRFDLAMLGTLTIGMMRENLHVGDPTAMMAAAASLNPNKDADDQMVPQKWKWGYSLNWCRVP